MKTKRIIFFSFFAIVLIAAAGMPTKSQFTTQTNGNGLIAGQNVNMVTNDPYLQRQNETSLAVSTINPLHILAGANDYSLIDVNGEEYQYVTHDAWLGVFKSFDGGDSWEHDLLPPYDGLLPQVQVSSVDPLSGFDAAADPTVRAFIDGKFFYSGIAFDRTENGDSVIFVARFHDEIDDIVYDDTTIIDTGTSGQFSDKPWIATDIPRPGNPNGVVYIVYSIFLGQTDEESPQKIHSKILVSRSTNGGNTWEKPIKISEGDRKCQGTCIAVDPIDGTVYIVWRLFAHPSEPDAIAISKSTDFGQTFTPSQDVAIIPRPFDQSTIGGPFMQDPAQFRTSAFPALAVDEYGTVHVAWSQRDVDLTPGFADDGRIVIASQAKGAWGTVWNIDPVESPVKIFDTSEDPPVEINGHSHQFQPSLTYGAGKLMIAWYDSRYSSRVIDEHGNIRGNNYPFCPFGESTIEDPADRIIDYYPLTDPYACDYRETIDVRTAQAAPSDSPDFDPSIQVSRYIWILEENDGGDPPYIPLQVQFNPPNYKLFHGGAMAFHGDYLDIAPAPMFIQDNNGWRFNQDGDPFVFYTSWTDNRDVIPPDNNIWTVYVPPEPGNHDCTSGMRNQNIYVSKITRGIDVDVLGQFINTDSKHVFVLSVQNETGSPLEGQEEQDEEEPPELPYKSFKLEIIGEPEGVSFFPDPLPDPLPPGYPQGTTEHTIFVDVPDHSSISRMVFVTDGGAYPIEVLISEELPGQDSFSESVFLNPVTCPSITGSTTVTVADIINWDGFTNNPLNQEVNPYILNPNALGPNALGPNALGTSFKNPNALGPNALGMSILNPNALGQAPGDVSDTSLVVDKIWNVTNNTGAISSYTLKSIAGDLPPDSAYFHLLIFKEHFTPFTDGCELIPQVYHELLVNIIDPYLLYADDIKDIKQLLGDPQIEFENATFSLGPGESALVMLRIIDLNPSTPQPEIAQSSGNTPVAESVVENTGAVVVAHSSTENMPVNAVTLMILPANLADGQAGVSYYPFPLNAIGGKTPYSWEFDPASTYPAGLAIDSETGEISGTPRESGNFTFTVIVTDDNGATDTQGFSIYIADPPMLTVVLDPNPPPSAIKGVPYSGLTLTASGGVPYFGAGQLYSWALYGEPLGLGLELESSSGGVEVMKLTGTPGEAGNFPITIDINDNFITYEGGPDRPVTIPFDLCVRPAEPFDLLPLLDGNTITCDSTDASIPPICPLPNGELGADYAAHNVTLATQNHEPITGSYLTWEIVDGNLPPGLEFNPDLSAGPVSGPISLAIQGTPTYDGDPNYPKPYTVTVGVTDFYDFGGDCAGDRYAEKTLAITVNPKGKIWAFQESGYEGAATAVAAAADDSGNVYVTGWYINDTTEEKNWFTRKYDADGTPGWEAFYNGPGTGDDVPSAIAIDDVGVIVTGTSEGKTSGQDIRTVKYDLENGDVIWDDIFDGPSHLGDGVYAAAHDTAKNLFCVAGWVHRGQKNLHADGLVLNYDSISGELRWAETYDSRRNGEDFYTAVAIDPSGNIIATGKSRESLSKDPTSLDFLTVMYDSTGRLLWEVRDDGPGFGDDEPTAIAIDPTGEKICITGQTTGGTNGADYYTVMYDSNGTPLWGAIGKTYDGPGHGTDIPRAIAVDDSGVYVTGKSLGLNSNDFATVKYDTDGNLMWNTEGDDGDGSARFGGTGKDEAVAVAVDDSGEVFVAGFISTSDKGKDFVALNLNPDVGAILWIAQYPLPGDTDPDGDEIATALAMDASGIYLTGYSIQDGISRIATVKFIK